MGQASSGDLREPERFAEQGTSDFRNPDLGRPRGPSWGGRTASLGSAEGGFRAALARDAASLAASPLPKCLTMRDNASMVATMQPATNERPTARQIVRDDAAKYGWTLGPIPIETFDVFSRGNVKVVMGWKIADNQRLAWKGLALGVWKQIDGHLAFQDTTVMSIVTCRKWLAQPADDDFTDHTEAVQRPAVKGDSL